MSEHERNDDDQMMHQVAAQWRMARHDHPEATTHRIIEIIRDRMGPAGEADLASESLNSTPDVAFDQIESFVWSMEGEDNDEEDEGEAVNESAIPDHIPADLQSSEMWRLFRDGLRTALQLPDDELRSVLRNMLDQMDAQAERRGD